VLAVDLGKYSESKGKACAPHRAVASRQGKPFACIGSKATGERASTTLGPLRAGRGNKGWVEAMEACVRRGG